MVEFKVWTEDWNGEDDADTVECGDPEYAAEKWAEEHHADFDYPDNIDGVHVRAPDGTVTVWDIMVEPSLNFLSYKIEPLPKKSSKNP